MRRLVVIAAACALLAGCGGSNEAGVSDESGASLIHSGALAYVAIDSDLKSNQWQQVDELLHKFPGRDEWLTQLQRDLPEGVSYEDDIAPALGPEVDIAAVAAPAAGDASFVLLTKPDSLAKARALVRKLNESDPDTDAVTREVDGWLVVSESNEMIDRVLKGDDAKSLADDEIFKEAMAKLPEDALTKAYVNGRQLADLVAKYLNRGPQTTAVGDRAPFGLDEVDWITAALEAKESGIRFEADVKGAGGGELTSTAAPYASKLISGVPADALAFLTFRGGTIAEQLRKLQANPMFAPAFGEFERMSGVNLDDVLELIEHEVAFYIRRGAGLPEFSLALETPQTEGALATLDRLMARVASLMPTRVQEEQRGGLTVKSLSLAGRVTLEWAGFDGRVLLTSGPTGIGDYRGGGEKLGDDADYKDALDAAGAPAKTGGLIYLDLRGGVELIQSYLGLAGEDVSADLRANLKPLQSFVGYGTRDGDVTSVVAFLEVE